MLSPCHLSTWFATHCISSWQTPCVNEPHLFKTTRKVHRPTALFYLKRKVLCDKGQAPVVLVFWQEINLQNYESSIRSWQMNNKRNIMKKLVYFSTSFVRYDKFLNFASHKRCMGGESDKAWKYFLPPTFPMKLKEKCKIISNRSQPTLLNFILFLLIITLYQSYNSRTKTRKVLLSWALC